MADITLARVKELVEYDPATGAFTMLTPPDASDFFKYRWAGRKLGTWNDKGYFLLRLDGRYWRAHRIAWLIMTGRMPTLEIDHIDGNRGNNRFSNLREVSHRENAQNLKINTRNTSGYLGVSFFKKTKQWEATIMVDQVSFKLGIFNTAEDASAAYLEAKKRLHLAQPVPRHLLNEGRQ